MANGNNSTLEDETILRFKQWVFDNQNNGQFNSLDDISLTDETIWEKYDAFLNNIAEGKRVGNIKAPEQQTAEESINVALANIAQADAQNDPYYRSAHVAKLPTQSIDAGSTSTNENSFTDGVFKKISEIFKEVTGQNNPDDFNENRPKMQGRGALKQQEELDRTQNQANEATKDTAKAQKETPNDETIKGTAIEDDCNEVTHFSMEEAVTTVQIILNADLEDRIAQDGMFGDGTAAALDEVLTNAGITVDRNPDNYGAMIEALQNHDSVKYQELGDALAVMENQNVKVAGEPDASALARVYNGYEPDIDCTISTPVKNDISSASEQPKQIIIVTDADMKKNFSIAGDPSSNYKASLMSTGHLKSYSANWDQETTSAMQKDIMSLQKEYGLGDANGNITLANINDIRNSDTYQDLDYNQKGALDTRLDFYESNIKSGNYSKIYSIDTAEVTKFNDDSLKASNGEFIKGGIDNTINVAP